MIVLLLSLIGVAAGQHCTSTSHCTHHGPAVCGSDGRTYINTCYLNHAICLAKLQGKYIRLSHSGVCHTVPHTSTNTRCDQLCDDESASDKVCMSNGQTYESKCDAVNAQCNASHHHLHLTIIHAGACLDLHSSCQYAHKYQCDKSQNYLCASNGYTYQNECYFRESQCRMLSSPSAEPITVLHTGLCVHNSTNNSRNVDCSKYADLSLEGLAVEGQTVHIKTCPYSHVNTAANSTAVCADGFTYHNECFFCSKMAHLHKISYSQLNIPISHDGRCQHNYIIG